MRRHQARCHSCGGEVESRHPWDTQTCSCGRLSVSGGPQLRLVRWSVEPGSGWSAVEDDAVDDDSDVDDDSAVDDGEAPALDGDQSGMAPGAVGGPPDRGDIGRTSPGGSPGVGRTGRGGRGRPRSGRRAPAGLGPGGGTGRGGRVLGYGPPQPGTVRRAGGSLVPSR